MYSLKLGALVYREKILHAKDGGRERWSEGLRERDREKVCKRERDEMGE